MILPPFPFSLPTSSLVCFEWTQRGLNVSNWIVQFAIQPFIHVPSQSFIRSFTLCSFVELLLCPGPVSIPFPVDTKVVVVWSEAPKSSLSSREGRDASEQFLVNVKNITVEAAVIARHCYNTRNKNRPGEIMEDLPEKVSPELGTEGWIGVYFSHLFLNRPC